MPAGGYASGPGSLAVNGGRYIGTVPVGGPSTGAHTIGEFGFDTTFGYMWVCTTSGTPGTWSTGGKEIGASTCSSGSPQGTTSTSYADLSPTLTLAFIVPPVPFRIALEGYGYITGATGNLEGVAAVNYDSDTTKLLCSDYVWNGATGAGRLHNLNCHDRFTAARLTSIVGATISVGATFTVRAQHRTLNASNTMQLLSTAAYPLTLSASVA